MATRSTIALEYADGTVGQVYCHWDGYLENNGMMLYKHYVDPFKTRELLDLGDISSLGRVVGDKHPFSPFEDGAKGAHDAAKAAGATTFYGRDRGETGAVQKMFADSKELYRCHGGAIELKGRLETRASRRDGVPRDTQRSRLLIASAGKGTCVTPWLLNFFCIKSVPAITGFPGNFFF